MADIKVKGTRPTIFIPIAGLEKLIRYQNGLRGLLRKIEIGNCDPELKDNIKAVYELLSHLRYSRGIVKGPQPDDETNPG